MRVSLVVAAVAIVVLTECSRQELSSGDLGGETAAIFGGEATASQANCPARMPPPGSSSTFEVKLPDGRVGGNSDAEGDLGDNEWVLDVTPSQPAKVTVIISIEPAVVIESLSFVIDSPNGTEMWNFPAGAHLQEGVHDFTFAWDGTTREGEVAPGRNHLFAVATTERDERDACYGDLSGSQEGWGLGYLQVDDG